MTQSANLVAQTSTGTGTGNIDLVSVTGYRIFSTVFGTGSGNKFYYAIRHRSAAEFEVGMGYMSDSDTMVRDSVIESSNSNAAVSFSAGTKDVISDIPASLQNLLGTLADVATSGDYNDLINAPLAAGVEVITGTSHTPAVLDSSKRFVYTNSAAITVTIRDDLPENWYCEWVVTGTGKVTFDIGGFTTELISSSDLVTKQQNEYGKLVCIGNVDASSAEVVLVVESTPATDGYYAVSDSIRNRAYATRWLLAEANWNYCVAIGYEAEAGNNTDEYGSAVAIGYQAKALHNISVAIGAGAESLTVNAVAIGDNVVVDDANNNGKSHALGNDITVDGEWSICFGATNSVAADKSIYMGHNGTVTHDECFIVGDTLTSTADKQVWFGNRYFKLGGVATASLVSSSAHLGALVYDTTVSKFKGYRSGWETLLLGVVDDTAPTLGGNLTVGSYGIISASNGDIPITPNGTGRTKVTGLMAPLTSISETTQSRTLALTDSHTNIICSNATKCDVTVPPNGTIAFPIGTVIWFSQIAAGPINLLEGSGVNVEGFGIAGTNAQWTQCKITKTDTNTWIYENSAAKPLESIAIACSDLVTSITTGTGKAYFRMPYAFNLIAVRASALVAPTGSTIIIDINEDTGGGATTVLSTKLSIDASEKTSTTAASAAVISDATLADDSEITIDFDQVGSTVAGKGIIVTLYGYRTA